jgi:V/A-type H+-transporting ATPase subunit D
MQSIKPTRSEFLRTRKRILLAKKGHDLLKKKQDSLIIEFFKLLKEVKADRDALQTQYATALRKSNEARALESDLRIQAAALAVQQVAPVTLKIRNIAGVKVPSITRESSDAVHPAYDSLLLQDVGNAYLDVVEYVLSLAAKETALRKLLIEIRKTKRRAHALEHILIPQLTAAKKHIQFELEERERENFSRLKRRKS